MSNEETWLEADQAARRLSRTERQVYRYGQEQKVRTRRYGRRLQYHAGDVETLAERLGVDNEARPIVPRQDIMPPGVMLDYLRERDRELAESQRRLEQAAIELGAARQEIGRRQLVDQELDTVRSERDQLRVQIAELQPWRRWGMRLIWALAIVVILALVAIIVIGVLASR
jgi:hypothetical protein